MWNQNQNWALPLNVVYTTVLSALSIRNSTTQILPPILALLFLCSFLSLELFLEGSRVLSWNYFSFSREWLIPKRERKTIEVLATFLGPQLLWSERKVSLLWSFRCLWAPADMIVAASRLRCSLRLNQRTSSWDLSIHTDVYNWVLAYLATRLWDTGGEKKK